MSIALKDANGTVQTLPTGTYDSNGNLQVALTAIPLATGAAKSTDIAAVIQALAPLATDADLQAVTNKMEAVRALIAAVQTIQGTVTANLGTLNGAALDATVQAAVTALGTLHSDVGANHADLTAILTKLGTTLLVSAAALPLPAGAATEARLVAILTALGTPLQAGGAVSVSNLPATQAVTTPTPAVPITGQQAVTAAAVALPSRTLLNGIVIKAKPSNAGTVFVGGTGVTTTYDGTGTGYPLVAGEAMSFAVANLNSIFIVGTAGDVVSFGGN